MNASQFRYWTLEDPSTIAALLTGCRRGIYVLHFENGERYVGQAVDVVTRYTTHRHGSKHHAPWKDVTAFEFLEVPVGDLDEIEKATIQHHKATHQLRNKLFNFEHWEPCTLDPFVAPEAQRHWATGQPSYDLTPFVAAAKRSQGPEPRLLTKKCGQELLPDGRTVGEAVIDELAQVVQHIIPNAVETEARFWSISDYPETVGGRFATLNVGWLELAYFPRRRFEAELGSLEASNELMWYLNAEIETFVAEEDVPDDVGLQEEIQFVAEIGGMPYYWGRIPSSYSVPVDCIGMPLGAGVVEQLEAQELMGARRLAIHAMRTGSARVNARSYSAELTRRVYERILERETSAA
ncbi:GIY-YIG nuclease family protein [Leucobacter insecticola]|uniref:GIY-YIG nuclease family protein n=1 Tax=Leucobacter insecticola TaxID=2714934 RepID=A0A6G8FHC1_9MICO|nr:GIY-YIG nuclease family protein [Leucobacter insecticola]QIM15758.1 GIY-YIG nuclease family protein [Leucobacter insecticola]